MDDDNMNRFAQDLTKAFADAIAESPHVEACRAKVRQAGYEMRITLEAVVDFADRSKSEQKLLSAATPSWNPTRNDRRFLRALRIGADEPEKAVD